jgi:hypothetical protein
MQVIITTLQNNLFHFEEQLTVQNFLHHLLRTTTELAGVAGLELTGKPAEFGATKLVLVAALMAVSEAAALVKRLLLERYKMPLMMMRCSCCLRGDALFAFVGLLSRLL